MSLSIFIHSEDISYAFFTGGNGYVVTTKYEIIQGHGSITQMGVAKRENNDSNEKDVINDKEPVNDTLIDKVPVNDTLIDEKPADDSVTNGEH